jgi:hypothetical protein
MDIGENITFSSPASLQRRAKRAKAKPVFPWPGSWNPVSGTMWFVDLAQEMLAKQSETISGYPSLFMF